MHRHPLLTARNWWGNAICILITAFSSGFFWFFLRILINCLVVIAVFIQWAHDYRLSALWPNICVSDLSAGSSRKLKKRAVDVPAGWKYRGGTPWRGILWGGYFVPDCFSADLCAREGIRNMVCEVFLPLSNLSLHSLVCQSEQGLIWMSFSFLSRKALTRYQMLFRHMFYCKHVERQLCNVWISNKTAKQFSLHSAKWYDLFFCWMRCEVLGFLLASCICCDMDEIILTWERSLEISYMLREVKIQQLRF